MFHVFLLTCFARGCIMKKKRKGVRNMKKILYIGNSFSEDATRYLQAIADGELYVRNIYIGGCSLERHAHNVEGDLAEYVLQEDAKPIRNISVREALTMEKWDAVSIQQVSGKSGLIETYEPYISTLIDEIKRHAPGAKIVFHRTWAYDTGAFHPDFAIYGNDMERMICETTATIAERYSLSIIPAGNAVQMARRLDEFRIGEGKYSLTRDSFHLSLDYGRYLAGLVHYVFHTGKSATRVKFYPEGCDIATVEKLRQIADKAFEK